jgi:hypothetical protein
VIKLRTTNKAMGTPVPCPACRYPNLRIDIWCERCGAPLEASPAEKAVAAAATTLLPDPPPEGEGRTPRRVHKRPAFTLPRVTMPAIPRLIIPAIAMPRVRMPRFAVPQVRLPRASRIVWVVIGVLAILLIAPLARVLLPSIRPGAARPSSGSLPATNGGPAISNSAEAVAIAGVTAKTGLRYAAGKCVTSAPCLTVAGQTLGQDAVAVVFSTASAGGRQCVGYVYRSGGSWHFLDAVCGLPGQLSPLVGHDAVVRVPGACANVRNGASLRAAVVACVKNGTTVHVDGGPTYADGRLWWHEQHGWMAHDFLTGP